MRIKVGLFGRELSFIWNKKNFSFYSIKKPKAGSVGITSRCIDLKHVLFLDYDNIERWIVEDELRLLQHYFKLTPFYLFTTKEEINKVSNNKCGNYHAICLTKRHIHEISEMQDKTHIDWRYKKMFSISRYKSWVLRALPKGEREKPKYLGLVGDMINLDNDVSEAHLNILKYFYDVDEVDYKNLDGIKKTILTSYKTNAGLKNA